ncbi:hypothetical protein GIB67_003102 [Kingdonia uniflora]|uniref:Uncharacterized protein n=1 Tax=Kingdonia uniflora TaxID=39325 RepID=A0A7J7N5Y7_9MAGN|nr:hypothetical protein GIB67_003102 [Kingdonia uniflora]
MFPSSVAVLGRHSLLNSAVLPPVSDFPIPFLYCRFDSGFGDRCWADFGVVFDWGIWVFGGGLLGFDVVSKRAA